MGKRKVVCTCPQAIEDADSVTILNAQGATIALYSKSCPVHGVTSAIDLAEIASITQTAWLNRSELRRLRTPYITNVTLHEVAPDKRTGLVSWSVSFPTGMGDAGNVRYA